MGDPCECTPCPCLDSLRIRIFGDKHGGKVDPGQGRGGGVEPAPAPAPAPADTSVPHGSSSVYKAMFAFEARDGDEVSFQEGDRFNVISRLGGWWTVRKIDRDGYALGSGSVPGNYLEREETVDAQPWYFGEMSRLEAESSLAAPDTQPGTFLVRLSMKQGVGYVLSEKEENRVKHFKVAQKDGRFYVEADHGFDSLGELVDFYQKHQRSSRQPLGQSCKRRQPLIADLSRSTVDKWELPKEDFCLQEQLGSGFFADVFRGRWKNQKIVAVKIIKSDSLLHHDFQKEVQIMKRLRHPKLLSLLAICTDSSPYYIITELMEKGNLLDFLRGPEGEGLDVAPLIDMASQVADGMSYLEKNNSIHRDLAARNVLVGQNFSCKVADFGLARVIKEPFYITHDRNIPYKWSAPEAISHGKFSLKSDVWSFGILLYEIITRGGVPYPALSNTEAHQNVVKGYRMPSPPGCPDVLYSIMTECWLEDPLSRPDFQDVFVQLCNLNHDDE